MRAIVDAPPRSNTFWKAPTDAAAEFAPHMLRDYALIADGCRSALTGPRGEISWLCAPRWDSPAANVIPNPPALRSPACHLGSADQGDDQERTTRPGRILGLSTHRTE
jgi:hypothetical protein